MALCKFEETNKGPIYINPRQVVVVRSSAISGRTVVTLAASGAGSQGSLVVEINLDIESVAGRLGIHGA